MPRNDLALPTRCARSDRDAERDRDATMTADAIPSDVDPSETVLFLTPSTGGDPAACTALQTFGSPAETNALAVSYADSASERATSWRSHADAPPANFAVVVVGRGGTPDGPDIARNATRIESVPDGSDLTALGVTVTRILDGWGDHPYRTAVDFDSLTALLQYADRETAFRFLHTLTAQMDGIDGGGHFHLTPDAVDDRTYHLLRPLFDAVVERTEDGWEVRRGGGGASGTDP
ncbi:DUF7504 family protein [Salinirarus marinus]|uniref:DUF7504 family protein n=1 Tax=Salinirarus marinus TaxID=3068310 RepID=UPI003C6C12B6